MPKQTWINLPEGKRQRVLAAAMAEFGTQGFSGGSLNVISREAGVAKGSLFQYFEDKLDLFAHVCESSMAHARQHMDAALERHNTGQPLFDLLRAFVGEWIAYFSEHPLQRGVTLATYFEMDPEVRRTVRAVANANYDQALRPLIAVAATSGDLRDDADHDVLLALLILLLPHLALAPHVPELDPVLGMYGMGTEELGRPATGMLDALERAFVADDVTR